MVNTIKGWGIEKVEYVDTRQAVSIPRTLRLSFMLGAVGIIAGVK
jgi:hypothetical protein